MRNIIYIPTLFVLLLSLRGLSQPVITHHHTAEELSSMLGGAGITILDSDILYTTPGYSLGQFHYHEGFSADLGMDSGIVLSTGILYDTGMAPGIHNPAYRDAKINFFGTGIVSPDVLTYDTFLYKVYRGYDSIADYILETGTVPGIKDLCELELDFIPEGDSIYIRFVFACERWNMCNTNAVAMGIAFYERDTDEAGDMVNMAVVPGTDIPISTNSVNFAPEDLITSDTSTMRYCRRYGEGSPFSDFLIDNDEGEQIVFDRYTQVMTGRAAVVPFRPYKMRIMIGDMYTSLSYDGALFLEAGSLTTVPLGGVGIEEEQKATFFSVHPNPVRDRIAIYWRDPDDPGPVQAELLDITGRVVITASGHRNAIQDQLNAQLHTLVSGSYFLRVTTAQSTQVVKLQKW